MSSTRHWWYPRSANTRMPASESRRIVLRPWARSSRCRAGVPAEPARFGRMELCDPEPMLPQTRARPPADLRMLPPTSPSRAGRSRTPRSIGHRTRSPPACTNAASASATSLRSSSRPVPSTCSPTWLRPRSARSPRASTTGSRRASAASCSTARSRDSSSQPPSVEPTGGDAEVVVAAVQDPDTPASPSCAATARRPTSPMIPTAPSRSSSRGAPRAPEGRAVHQPAARVHHADRRRRHLGWWWPQLHRHVVRAPRLHDEARPATCNAAGRTSSCRGGAPRPRCDSSSASG